MRPVVPCAEVEQAVPGLAAPWFDRPFEASFFRVVFFDSGLE